MPERITTSAAASICGYSTKTLRRYAQAGIIPGAMRLDDNADWRFDEATLRRWVARREADTCRAISTNGKGHGTPVSRFTAETSGAAYERLLGLKQKSGSRSC